VFDWLFEGQLAVYVVLVTVALLLVVIWWQLPKRYWLLAAWLVMGLAVVYFLLDHLVETDREQIDRKIKEMSSAVRARSLDGIFTHVSSQFRLGGLNRDGFRTFVDQVLRQNQVDEIVVWDIAFPPDFRTTSGSVQSARVLFQVKARGRSLPDSPFRCEAQLIRDPDGQWRLQGFQLFNPLVDSNQPIQIPQLPR
jgi:hypothetical protein